MVADLELIEPTPGGDDDVWGTKLVTALTAIQDKMNEVIAALPGGGSMECVVHAIDIDHTNPDLLTGIEWWTPDAGEVIAPTSAYYSAYENVIEAWAGTGDPAYFHIGSLVDGVFTSFDQQDGDFGWAAGIFVSPVANGGFVFTYSTTTSFAFVAPGGVPVAVLVDDNSRTPPDGGDPGVTAGHSVIYLVSAKPIF